MNLDEKKPAGHGGLLLDAAEHGKQSKINLLDESCANGQKRSSGSHAASVAAKLEIVDAVLYLAERTPPGFRSLCRNEIAGERWSTNWPDFFVECLRLLKVKAAVANEGTWYVEDLWVSARKMLGIQTESGWTRWFLPSIDGLLRSTGKSAAWVSRSPSGAMFWHQPKKKGAERLKLNEVLDRCVDWGLEVAA